LTKSITTLVSDIDKLFEQDVVATEAQVEELGRALTDMLKRRLSVPSEPRGLSMSNFGTPCKRKLWYQVNKPETAEKIDPQTKRNFIQGDITDTLYPFFAKWAGHTVEGEQDTMEYHGIVGHRDCVIDGVTIDIKTANSRSIDKFKNHKLEADDPFGYLDQLSLYVGAARRHDDPVVKVRGEGAFLVIDKERGQLVLDRYKTRDISEDAVRRTVEILSNDDVPKRHFIPESDGKSGNQVIPMPCRYCVYKEECYKDMNGGKGLIKKIFSTGPRWFTRIVKEPNPKVSQNDTF
jgi:hypothetical protein